LTLNLQEILSGAVIGDTKALGVFVVHIKYAEDLSAQDRNGRSDPYIVLAYAKVRTPTDADRTLLIAIFKFGKPLYSTRIIIGDLNPVFEETAFMLVTQDEVKADENLAAMLWDSDKWSAE
jgi:Ca2+-dependent lipid-binding protein